ncbi:MAG: hypothetical protein WB995_02665 [Candidatus Acidiferrales bacterium]
MAGNGAIDPHKSPNAAGGPGYETRDASIAGLLKFAASLAVVLIVVSFGMLRLFDYFQKTQSLGPAATPFENARTIPALPRLQVEPRKEIHDYWEGEQEILNSYGWADKHNGVVRLPIDRAMRLVLERGLPVRPAGAAKAAGSESEAASQ